MRLFLKILFAFIYCCLTFFIGSNTTYACNVFTPNPQNLSYILQTKTERAFTNKLEETYFVSNNQNRCQIAKTSTKSHNFGSLSGYKSLSEEDILNNFIFTKNNINFSRITHNISPNLKNAIYTRAP